MVIHAPLEGWGTGKPGDGDRHVYTSSPFIAQLGKGPWIGDCRRTKVLMQTTVPIYSPLVLSVLGAVSLLDLVQGGSWAGQTGTVGERAGIVPRFSYHVDFGPAIPSAASWPRDRPATLPKAAATRHERADNEAASGWMPLSANSRSGLALICTAHMFHAGAPRCERAATLLTKAQHCLAPLAKTSWLWTRQSNRRLVFRATLIPVPACVSGANASSGTGAQLHYYHHHYRYPHWAATLEYP